MKKIEPTLSNTEEIKIELNDIGTIRENKNRSLYWIIGLSIIAVLMWYNKSLLISLVEEMSLKHELSNLTVEEKKQKLIACYQKNDSVCVIRIGYILEGQIDDNPKILFLLGSAIATKNSCQEAIPYFEKSLNAGGYGFDLSGKYSMCLSDTGKHEEAIKWGYISLKSVPTLRDVANKVVSSLSAKERFGEAISVIDNLNMAANPRKPPSLFLERRAILEQKLGKSDAPSNRMRTAAGIDSHFRIPINIGGSNYESFMVDTGATALVFSKKLLNTNNVGYKFIGRSETTLANKTKISGSKIIIDVLKLGPIKIYNIEAFVCDLDCEQLAGQSLLSKLSIKIETVSGIRFLEISR